MEDQRQLALNILDTLPESEASLAMHRLITFVIERAK